jgi:hypothetical protein
MRVAGAPYILFCACRPALHGRVTPTHVRHRPIFNQRSAAMKKWMDPQQFEKQKRQQARVAELFNEIARREIERGLTNARPTISKAIRIHQQSRTDGGSHPGGFADDGDSDNDGDAE